MVYPTEVKGFIFDHMTSSQANMRTSPRMFGAWFNCHQLPLSQLYKDCFIFPNSPSKLVSWDPPKMVSGFFQAITEVLNIWFCNILYQLNLGIYRKTCPGFWSLLSWLKPIKSSGFSPHRTGWGGDFTYENCCGALPSCSEELVSEAAVSSMENQWSGAGWVTNGW